MKTCVAMSARRRASAISIATGVAVSVALHAAQSGTLVPCAQIDQLLWERSAETLGIFVTDASRHIGGAVGILKFDPNGLGVIGNALLGGYHPVSGAKEIACGKLLKWEVYRLGRLEKDLHPFIKPASSFNYVLSELPSYSTQDCSGGCIWGEVTVPAKFEWFWKEGSSGDLKKGTNVCKDTGAACVGKTQELVGGKFCMYGPWIIEKAHAFHPELHPVQAFWGQTNKGYASIYFLDDDSKRFDSIRAFDWQHLSHPFQPWSGQLNATLFQIIRIDPLKNAVVTWDDGTAGKPASDRIDTGAGTADVRHPDWVRPTLKNACRAADGKTQAVLEAAITVDQSHPWRGLNISGTDTGITYGAATAGSGGTPPVSPPDDESSFEARFVEEWNLRNKPLPRDFSSNATAWGVPKDEDWTAMLRQRIVVTATSLTAGAGANASSVPAGLQSAWTVTASDLDNPAGGVSNLAVNVDLDYPRGVSTKVDGNVRVDRHDTTNRGQFALLVRFPAQEFGDIGVRVANYKILVRVKVWNEQHADEKTFELYSIVPDHLAAVSGYNLQKMKGVFPDRLARMILPLVRGNGCSVTFEEFLDELNDKPSPEPSADPLSALVRRRPRSIGILRETVHYFLRDRTLGADEFSDLQAIFLRYQSACAGS